MSRTTFPHQPRTTPRRLFEEWDQLRRSPRHVRRAAAWGLSDPAPQDLDEVLIRSGWGGDRSCTTSDRYLQRLVAVATEDDLAARVVLQRILPGLVARARRRGRIERGGTQRAFDELVAAAWLVIRTYPVERRPLHLAANLLRDAEYQAFVRTRRLRWVAVEVPSDDPASHPVDELDPGRIVADDPRRQLDELLDRARRHGVDERHLVLLAALGRGEHPDQLAARWGISDRAVRARRAAAIAQVRELVG